MSVIQATARLRIHDGKVAEFKEVAHRCIETVRTKDTGTLQYDWFLQEAASECVVREAYSNSDAVFEHMENLGPVLGELLALCEMDLEIYGQPSQALSDVLKEFGARMYLPLQSG